eukprot:9927703-Lingulodinium_polyedra.AAC.1
MSCAGMQRAPCRAGFQPGMQDSMACLAGFHHIFSVAVAVAALALSCPPAGARSPAAMAGS